MCGNFSYSDFLLAHPQKSGESPKNLKLKKMFVKKLQCEKVNMQYYFKYKGKTRNCRIIG